MNEITVVIPVSPIPSHPDTEVIDQTVASIRERLPESEIIITFDGLPAWFAEYKPAYEEFKSRLLWKINNEMGLATPMVFAYHMHQSGMMRRALEIIKTPLILFSEQDTPLHNDIPFDQIKEPVLTGYANLVRFHHEAAILPDHEHLMLDHSPIDILGVPFLRTRQWSQRPHLASTQYYRDICAKYFDNQPRFIEHIMYGIVLEGNYDEHRLHVYAPDGSLVRHKHIDGRRKGASVYDPRPS
jgi:hypothetical protein